MRGGHIIIGPVVIRLSSKSIARWGYPRLRIGGLSVWTRDSGGRLQIVGYHPKKSLTWHWFVSLYKTEGKPGLFNLEWRKGFGERGLHLLGCTLGITRQGYHRERADG